jgi:hypothetical protein
MSLTLRKPVCSHNSSELILLIDRQLRTLVREV